jgi:hypothetical protein
MRQVLLCGLAWLVLASGRLPAVEPLSVAQGTVDKVEKEALTVRTREPDGKFGKKLVLKVTGTSRLTTLRVRMQAGKAVPTQTNTELKDVEPKQVISLVYMMVQDTPVLLTAVVQSPDEK